MLELNSCRQVSGYIPQLTGLKITALLGIFYWHSMPQTGLPDLGARLVELFFVVSGFLVGFRNHGTFDESISGCWKYLWPKVKALYPVYLLGLALGVLQHIMRGGWQIGADTVFPIVWALGLQQAWIPSIAMVYNGASWFISAWAFCMLCAPMLQWLLEQVRGALRETRGLIALFALMLVVRAFLETCQVLSPGVYPYSLHVTPFIRLLEFGAAYLIGVSFRGCRDGANRSFFFQTVMEAVAIAGAFACVVLFDEVWPRWAFVLLWIIVVPILAGGGGLISCLLSWRPLVSCGRIEMEFFLLHNATIGITAVLFSTFSLGGYKKVALASLLVTLVLSIVCHRLFRRRSQRLGGHADSSSERIA